MTDKRWSLTCSGRMWFNINQTHFLGPNRIALLEQIADLGSISKAAKAMGISYKAAWDTLDAMNALTDKPLVQKISGGRGGGGSHVTEHGLKLIRFFRKTEEAYHQYLNHLNEQLREEFGVFEPSTRPGLLSKTPNREEGKITGIARGSDFARITVQIGGDSSIVAAVPLGAAGLSTLKAGQPVLVFIKPTDIDIIGEGDTGGVLSSNSLAGTVDRITEGAFDARIAVRLDSGGVLTGNQAMGSSRELGVFKGQRVLAVFSPHAVVLARTEGKPAPARRSPA